MSLTKYYKILGLPPGADQTAVRKAFRKLAMRYHPDKNPSASAQAKFILITEAYEILTGKRQAPISHVPKSRSTQSRTGNTPVSKEQKMKAHADRVREAKERQEEQDKREFEENERYFTLLTTGWRWRIIRWSAILGIVLSAVLIIERFLPDHISTDKITHYSFKPGFSSGEENLSIVQAASNNTYWISRMTYDFYGRHTQMYVRSSWFFHEPIELISIGKVENRHYKVHFSFYSNFLLMIFFFLLPGLTLLIKNKTIFFTISHHISFYGVNILMLYFLLRNDHWAHLLTFGFL